MHYQRSFIIFIGTIFFFCTGLRAQEQESDLPFYDDTDIFDQFDFGNGPIRRSCSNADQIVPILNECGVVDLFKENIFLSTAPLNYRSLLDMPLFQSPIPTTNQWVFKSHLFVNKTPRSFFNKDNSGLAAVLAFKECSFINKIQNALETIKTNPDCRGFFITRLGIPPSFFDTDVAAIGALFACITVEERRAGILLDIMEKKGPLFVSVKVPIYWVERNFFLTEKEQQAIKDAELFPDEDAPSEKETMEFARIHLISDRIGIGDTRIMFADQIYDKNDSQIHLGGLVTIPTHVAFQKGVLGSEFAQCAQSPIFDLCEILNLGLDATLLEQQLKQDFDRLGRQFLDRLSAILLERNLGDERHVGAGLFTEMYLQGSDSLSMRFRASAEYIFACNESRFFVKKVNLEEFAKRDFMSSNEDIAEDNLRFLNQRLLDMFFPSMFNIRVRPGPIINVSDVITYRYNRWDFSLGGDFWWQGQEKFLDPNQPCLLDFEVEKARRVAALQLKIFGGLSYTIPREAADWIFSINGDKTVFSSGIGKDFTIDFGLTIKW